MVLPEMLACHIEDIKDDVHITANAVVDDAETCGGRSWVMGTFYVEEGGSSILRHIEIQFTGRRIVHDIPCAELEMMGPFVKFWNAESHRSCGIASKIIEEIVVEVVGT